LLCRNQGGGDDGHDRSNGTLQRSRNDGADWEFMDHIGTPTMGAKPGPPRLFGLLCLAMASFFVFAAPLRRIQSRGAGIALAHFGLTDGVILAVIFFQRVF